MSWAVDVGARLYDAEGRRKYLCEQEWGRFLAAASNAGDSRAFCQLLLLTGCRISEALEVTPLRLDPPTNQVIFRTLKRRKRVFRAVPVPEPLMRDLVAIAKTREPEAALWSWSRQTAWRRIKVVMEQADVRGPHATARGLRHGFGIANAEKNVPLGLTQLWMGHARLETTTIYQHPVGHEERAFAKRVWRGMGGG